MKTLTIDTGLGKVKLTYSEVAQKWNYFSGNQEALKEIDKICTELGWVYDQKLKNFQANFVAENADKFVVDNQKKETEEAKKVYKIGIYKNGQQIAKEVFASENLQEVKNEFVRMWNSTDFDPEGIDNQADTAEKAWYYKHFCEDTNNVAVFEVEEKEGLHTNYTYQGLESKMM